MSPEHFLDELRKVLGTEREAIRRMDANTIVNAAQQKEALMQLITDAPEADKPALVTALAQVREDLKRNLILLAHARELVRDAVARARPAALPPGARIAIKL